MTIKQKYNIEPVTKDLGVMKWGTTWRVMTLDDPGQIGSTFKTKQAACAYAFYRQETTFGGSYPQENQTASDDANREMDLPEGTDWGNK